jgi:hypothetical protein
MHARRTRSRVTRVLVCRVTMYRFLTATLIGACRCWCGMEGGGSGARLECGRVRIRRRGVSGN